MIAVDDFPAFPAMVRLLRCTVHVAAVALSAALLLKSRSPALSIFPAGRAMG